MTCKHFTLILLLILICQSCDHVLPAKKVKLPALVKEIREAGERAVENKQKYVYEWGDWVDKWVRFKARVKKTHPLPTDGLYLYTDDYYVSFWIRETDPASTRLEKYEAEKVYTFRVKIVDIRISNFTTYIEATITGDD